MNNVLYLPIEEDRRELVSRMLVALEAVNRGCAVVVGQKWAIENNLAVLPKGVIVYKTVDEPQCESARLARQHGHIAVAVNEEGIAPTDGGVIFRHFGLSFGDAFDCFYSIHEGQEAALRAEYEQLPEMICIGNPRVDLLKPKFHPYYADRVAELRARHGRFLLFNSNSSANWKFGGLDDLKDLYFRGGYIVDGVRDESLFHEMVWYDEVRKDITINFFNALDEVAPDVPVIIRPHPGEAPEYWEKFIEGRKNCSVERAGIANHWIAAAQATIVTGCTTGVEGYLMGANVINLDQEEDAGYREDNIAYHYLPTYTDMKQAALAMKGVMDGVPGAIAEEPESRRRLAEYLNAHDGFAYERLVNSLLERYPDLINGHKALRTLGILNLIEMPELHPGQQDKIQDMTLAHVGSIIQNLGRILSLNDDLSVFEPQKSMFVLARV
ncbi:surface carbohydrate biosynthesis protein [Magnetospira sp. QH-2]|uniref:surface carbohydrate biosynthesis protein n=1 Tax=Magnetospira sp. (strain QH-2) TaxID=1288970 RepID=UPI0003E80ADE|nr:surface carbohydrate biosynthesis protein [Magnetospira sp. QH-2]CCQ73088.1 protein of unknown function [Magnetospira sp. QH-2]